MAAATPEARSLAASVAAYSRWAHEDPVANAQRAQAGLLEKFRREVLDRDPAATEPDLTKRAERLRSAHMRRLVLERHRRARAAKTAQT